MGTLLDKTLKLLEEDERPLMDLSFETGISIYWLQKMKSGTIPDPSVNRTQQLYECLTKTKLKV